MTDRYRAYEAECERLRAVNYRLVAEFSTELKGRAVSVQTVRRHEKNLDLYLNHFLLYEDPVPAEQGIHRVGMFLGYWYPRKVLGISETSLRSMVSSLKQFYRFLNTKGLVCDEAVESLRSRTRSGMPEWLGALKRYR